MLSAIVQQATGRKIIDYLKPRLFQPLGIENLDWEVSPQGVNTGGWGLRVKTEQRIDSFIAMLDKLEDGKTYVFVEHPGLDDAELRAVSHIGYEDVAQGRQDVTTIFTSEKIKAAIIKKGVKLVSYKEALR